MSNFNYFVTCTPPTAVIDSCVISLAQRTYKNHVGSLSSAPGGDCEQRDKSGYRRADFLVIAQPHSVQFAQICPENHGITAGESSAAREPDIANVVSIFSVDLYMDVAKILPFNPRKALRSPVFRENHDSGERDRSRKVATSSSSSSSASSSSASSSSASASSSSSSSAMVLQTTQDVPSSPLSPYLSKTEVHSDGCTHRDTWAERQRCRECADDYLLILSNTYDLYLVCVDLASQSLLLMSEICLSDSRAQRAEGLILELAPDHSALLAYLYSHSAAFIRFHFVDNLRDPISPANGPLQQNGSKGHPGESENLVYQKVWKFRRPLQLRCPLMAPRDCTIMLKRGERLRNPTSKSKLGDSDLMRDTTPDDPAPKRRKSVPGPRNPRSQAASSSMNDDLNEEHPSNGTRNNETDSSPASPGNETDVPSIVITGLFQAAGSASSSRSIVTCELKSDVLGTAGPALAWPGLLGNAEWVALETVRSTTTTIRAVSHDVVLIFGQSEIAALQLVRGNAIWLKSARFHRRLVGPLSVVPLNNEKSRWLCVDFEGQAYVAVAETTLRRPRRALPWHFLSGISLTFVGRVCSPVCLSVISQNDDVLLGSAPDHVKKMESAAVSSRRLRTPHLLDSAALISQNMPCDHMNPFQFASSSDQHQEMADLDLCQPGLASRCALSSPSKTVARVFIGARTGNNIIADILVVGSSVQSLYMVVVGQQGHLGPIVDLQPICLEQNKNPQLLMACGFGRNGTIRILRNGIGISDRLLHPSIHIDVGSASRVFGVTDLPNAWNSDKCAPGGLNAVNLLSGDTSFRTLSPINGAYILTSSVSATAVFRLEPSVEGRTTLALSDSGIFATQEKTLFFGNLFAPLAVQITPSSVRLISCATHSLMKEIPMQALVDAIARGPSDIPAAAHLAAAEGAFLAVAIASSVIVLEITPNLEYTVLGSVSYHSEIAALDINVEEGLVSLVSWDNVLYCLRLYSAPCHGTTLVRAAGPLRLAVQGNNLCAPSAISVARLLTTEAAASCCLTLFVGFVDGRVATFPIKNDESHRNGETLSSATQESGTQDEVMDTDSPSSTPASRKEAALGRDANTQLLKAASRLLTGDAVPPNSESGPRDIEIVTCEEDLSVAVQLNVHWADDGDQIEPWSLDKGRTLTAGISPVLFFQRLYNYRNFKSTSGTIPNAAGPTEVASKVIASKKSAKSFCGGVLVSCCQPLIITLWRCGHLQQNRITLDGRSLLFLDAALQKTSGEANEFMSTVDFHASCPARPLAVWLSKKGDSGVSDFAGPYELRIGEVQSVDGRTQIESVSLRMTIERIAFHYETQIVVAACTREKVKKQGNRFLIGSLVFVQPGTDNSLQFDEFDEEEFPTALVCGKLRDLGDDELVIVGSSSNTENNAGKIRIFSLKRSRVMDEDGLQTTRLALDELLLYSTEAVTSLHIVDGILLVAFMAKVKAFRAVIDAARSAVQLKSESTYSAHCYIHVMAAAGQGRFLLGTLSRSIGLYSLQAPKAPLSTPGPHGKGKLFMQELALDYNPVWCTAVCASSVAHFLVADDQRNIISMTPMAEVLEAVNTEEGSPTSNVSSAELSGGRGILPAGAVSRLHAKGLPSAASPEMVHAGVFHTGYSIHSLVASPSTQSQEKFLRSPHFKAPYAATGKTQSATEVPDEILAKDVYWGSTEGATGMIIPIHNETSFLLLYQIQKAVESVLPPAIGLNYDRFRDYDSHPMKVPHRGFIDGNMVEKLLDLPREQQQRAFRWLRRKGGVKEFEAIDQLIDTVERLKDAHS